MSEVQPEISLNDVAWLTALARTLTRDGADADDLVQETWMAARTSPPPSGGPNRPWLATVLRRFHLQSLRSERRRDVRARAAARQEALPGTAELVERAELQRTLADCLLSLEDPYRTTLMLVAFEGVTTAEIAERDAVSVGVVRHRVRRAREMMRAKLVASDGEDWSRWCTVLLPFARLPLPGEAGAAQVAVSSKLASATVTWAGAAAMTLKLIVSISAVVVVLSVASLFDRTPLDVAPDVVRDVGRPSSATSPRLVDADLAGVRRSSAPSSDVGTVPVVAAVAEDVDRTQRVFGAPVEPPPRDSRLATIEIRIRSQESGWFASLMAEEPAFEGAGGPSWNAGRLETGYQMNASGGQGAGRTYGMSNAGGVYRFANVRPGIPLRVAAVDGFFFPGDEVDVPPLLPGESRVVEVVVTRTLRTFRGRVLSPSGDPIANATLQLSLPGEGRVKGDHTDGEGNFRMQPIAVDELILAVRAEGFASMVDRHFEIPNGPIDIVLERGRDVRIVVRNPDLEGTPDAVVVGRESGAGICHTAKGRTDAEGVCTLEAIPTIDLPLEVVVNGRMFRSVLLADELEHTVEVPASRSLTVRVVGSRSTRDEVEERISLRPVGPDEGEPQVLALRPRANEVVFDRVFTGTYEAVLERVERSSIVRTSDAVAFEVTESGPSEVVLEH